MSSLTPLPNGFSRVSNADVIPGRRICSLTIRGGLVPEFATGWVLGFHTIVTAAHAFKKVSSPQFDVFPGRNGPGPGLFGEFSTDLSDPAPESLGDFGAIFVREPIGDSVGRFQPPENPAVSLVGKRVVLSGYRAVDDAKEQLIGTGKVFTDKGATISYPELETVLGMSGSPVWIEGDHAHIVGIHTLPNGVALKITRNVAEKLGEWRLTEASRVAAGFPVLLSPAALSLPAPTAAAPLSIGRSALEVAPLAPTAATSAAISAMTSAATAAAIAPRDGAAYSDPRKLLAVADDIAATIKRAQPPLTSVTVQIRTQTTPWQPRAAGDVLSLEEQSLVSALAARLSGVSVSCPQILGRRPAGASGTTSDASNASTGSTAPDDASAILDVVFCVDGDDTVGCATLLASGGVVRDSHAWPPSSTTPAPTATLSPTASPAAAANEPPPSSRLDKRVSKKKRSRR